MEFCISLGIINDKSLQDNIIIPNKKVMKKTYVKVHNKILSKTSKKQILLVVLDGWGHRDDKKHNAIALAKKPIFSKLWDEYPHSLLFASGRAVGLPDGQMGNSEVGHMAIGAGKVVYTDLVRITDSAKNNNFSKNLAFKKLFAHVKKNKSSLHVTGLLGPGGIHSHTDHLYDFLKTAKEADIKNIYIHVFTDGRDTPPKSASDFLSELEKEIEKLDVGYISSICGRYLAMDRDNNWDRLKKAEEMLFDNKGNIIWNKKASKVVKGYYQKNLTDEYIEPTIFADEVGHSYPINKNDGVFFFNFRADRARMISQKILERKKKMNLFFVSMTQYDKKLKTEVAFAPVKIETTLAKEISKAKLTQAHIAETEKFAHATYFLNGGEQKAYLKEKQILIDSRKDIPTHDLAPEMKAKEIADEAIKEIERGTNFIFVNFANPDMVGHTGNEKAIKTAIEITDRELGRIIKIAEKKKVVSIITADHGNAELNVDPKTGEKHTAHTTNPVPFIVTDKRLKVLSGELSGIAPTILDIFKIKIPKSMSGKKLIK
ncbi:MAG: 2,3-bisphosphoglycerate-independent phosphoglycerate mutase [Candidatus Pacebacteria bacterium]|nr:2,3-bisphosphoglycerate-independent phosphoglycerate mutase [Candidatus Paceibacterota bacterium]